MTTIGNLTFPAVFFAVFAGVFVEGLFSCAVVEDFTFVFGTVVGIFAVGFDFVGVLVFTTAVTGFFGGDFLVGAVFLVGAALLFDFGSDARKSLLLLPKSWLKMPIVDSAKQTNKSVILQLLNIKFYKTVNYSERTSRKPSSGLRFLASIGWRNDDVINKLPVDF